MKEEYAGSICNPWGFPTQWVIEDGKIQLIYCPTEEMLADALTKVLPSTKVKHFVDAFGLATY